MPAPLRAMVDRPDERNCSRAIAACKGDMPADSGRNRSEETAAGLAR